MKEVRAVTCLTVEVECPLCSEHLDIADQVGEAEAWLTNRLDIPKCEIEITCEECGGEFLVTKVDF